MGVHLPSFNQKAKIKGKLNCINLRASCDYISKRKLTESIRIPIDFLGNYKLFHLVFFQFV